MLMIVEGFRIRNRFSFVGFQFDCKRKSGLVVYTEGKKKKNFSIRNASDFHWYRLIYLNNELCE